MKPKKTTAPSDSQRDSQDLEKEFEELYEQVGCGLCVKECQEAKPAILHFLQQKIDKSHQAGFQEGQEDGVRMARLEHGFILEDLKKKYRAEGFQEAGEKHSCYFAKEGQGDCPHFFGLPDRLDETTTDVYGKPNDWCWWCWNRYLIDLSKQDYNLGFQEAVGRVKPTILRVCQEFSDRTYKNTILGKFGPMDVTQEDWDNSSFTFEEMADKVVDSLKPTQTQGSEGEEKSDRVEAGRGWKSGQNLAAED